MRALARALLRLLFRVRVIGASAAVRGHRVMIVAKHDSFLDAVFLGLFLPCEPTVVVTPQDRGHLCIRLLLKLVPHVVVDPARPWSLKKLVRLLIEGRPIAVFPQLFPTPTGGMTKVYAAAARIAARHDALVVPVGISGTLYSRYAAVGGRYPRRYLPRVTLTVLPAQSLRQPEATAGRSRRGALADDLLRIMQHAMFAAERPRVLFEALLDAAQCHGLSTCILEDTQRRYTYRDLIKGALALSRLARQLGGQGEIVGVMMPNVAATVLLVFGLGLARRVPALLNYTAGTEQVVSACVAAGVRTLVTSRRFVAVAHLEPVLSALGNVRIVYVEDLRASLTLRDKFWLLARALPRPRSVIGPREPEDTAVILFTSGSEARPKGVALAHRALLANMAQMAAVIDFGPNDKFLAALPLYHSYSLTACTLMPLLYGTRVCLYTTPLHYHVIPELAYTRACTYVFGTSTFLGHYARQAHPYDFVHVRVVVSGAERLNPEVAQQWLTKFGLRIMEGYGATECAPGLSLNTPLCYKPGSVGRLLPGIEHRIVPVAGIPRGGVLHVRGPNLMSGYYLYQRPGILQPPVSEAGAGWYDTGDVVEVDGEGYIFIQGRVRRFAKIAGEMVSLEVVERIAHRASPTHQHAATVELVAHGGESTVLFTTDAALSRAQLHAAAREAGSQELAVARRIVHLPELPLLGSGKTDYVRLAQHTFDSERLTGGPSPC
jgi:acyl-[acyl-carrier-protein]-phospholipid O-acyltransferase/long-chain-fatty-acid--[acyl-carrier-protein] ligase